MPMRQELIHKRLIEEGRKLLSMFGALPPQQRDLVVYRDERTWTVKDVLAHQVSAERGYLALIDDLLAGGEGTPKDFSIDGYNAAEVATMQDISWEELVEQFRIARADTVALAARLTSDQLDRLGRHPFLGIATVEDILQLLYRHNMMHMRDVRRSLGE